MASKWNSPANKAALKGIPVAIFAAAGISLVVAGMGGNVTPLMFGIIAVIAYAFSVGALMKRQ